MRVGIFALFATVFAGQVCAGEQDVRAAAGRSVKLLQNSMGQWKQNCISCHHQVLPLMALHSARQHGIAIDEKAAQGVLDKVFGDFLSSVDTVVRYNNIGDAGDMEGYLLTVGHALGIAPSLTTKITARRIARMQYQDGHWPIFDARPPHSYSVFMATALVAKAVKEYAPEESGRVEQARRWLESAKAESAEDHTFRMLGLLWTGAAAEVRKRAAKEALALQHADGGWGQVAGMESDAYSTAELVYALRESAGVASGKGTAYLLKAQKPDGSWQVETRLKAVAPVSPPYFETGFPGGHNQFLSCAATAWAVMALAETLPARAVKPMSVAAAVPKNVQPWMEKLDDPKAASDGGTTALMLAAHDAAKVKMLIERGADVKARTKTGYDALTVASQYRGNVESVRLLLAHGASPAPRKGVLFNMSALFVASGAGDAEIVKLLLQHGASPKEASILFGFYPYRPIEIATQFQHAEVLRALVQGGATVDLEDSARMTPLSAAALYHKDTSLATLLELGANPKHVDKYGYTPLQHTPGIRNSSPKTAEILKAALK